MKNELRIAVPVTRDNQIDEHFGHCEFYRIYTISDEDKIINEQTIDSLAECGCKSEIANILAKDGVTLMLAGGIGSGAVNALKRAGIEVVRGCSGDAKDMVNRYLTGSIVDSGSNCQTHEHHQHNHEHHHGDHKCNH